MDKKYSVEEVKERIEDYFNRKPVKIRDEDGDIVMANSTTMA